MHVNKILYVWSKSFHIKFLFPYICFIFITYVTLQFNPHFIFYIPIYRVITNNYRGHTQYTPDATPCDFFLWGYVKDHVYVSPLPAKYRYESEPPLKPSPLTCYRQFGTNWIIVLMFVESQRVHI